MRVPAYLKAEDRVMTHGYVSIVYWQTEKMFHFGKTNLCLSVFSAANVVYYLLEMPFSLEFAAGVPIGTWSKPGPDDGRWQQTSYY